MEKERKEKKIKDGEYGFDRTLTEYIVEEGIEEIGEGAFYDCKNLEKISFSRGIRKIRGGAFYGCEKIEEIILKEGLEEIGTGAFLGCSSLKHVTLVKGIRKIGNEAFACTALTHFEMNEGLEEVGRGIFVDCKKLKTISFPLHKIRNIHKGALASDTRWDYDANCLVPKGPPLPLETLILRRPVSSLPSESIPFPRITNKDNGQLVRFIDTEQEKLFRLELSHLFFVCFALKCTRNGLYNAYGAPVLARTFRYFFRGARLRFPLKRKHNEQSTLVKKLYTRLAATQSALKKKVGTKAGAGGGTTVKGEERADEDFMDELRKRNEQLKRRNTSLLETIKKLKIRLQRAQRLRGTARRTAQTTARTDSGLRRSDTTVRSPIRPGTKREFDFDSAGDDDDDEENGGDDRNMFRFSSASAAARKGDRTRADMLEDMLRNFARAAPTKKMRRVVEALRDRLVSTERTLRRLSQERDALLAEKQDRGGDEYAASTSSPTFDDLRSLKRSLRDKTAQLRLLDTRYSHLKARSNASKELQDQAVAQMESYNRTIRELRREVQELVGDRQQLVGCKRRIEELDDELRECRAEARELEQRNLQLCSSPFVDVDVADRRDRVRKLELSEKMIRQQKVQIAHLQETARTHHKSIVTLREQLSATRKENRTLVQDNEGLSAELHDATRRVRSVGGDGIADEETLRILDATDEDVHRALAIVRRRREIGGDRRATTNDDADADVFELRQKIEALRTEKLQLLTDVEKAENMLEIQTRINHDLETKIATGSGGGVSGSMENVELKLEERTEQVRSLRAQLEGLLGGDGGGGGGGNTERKKGPKTSSSLQQLQGDDDAVAAAAAAARVTRDLLDGEPLGPSENVLEIWIRGGRFDGGLVPKDVSTFCMLDFFDFETQTTPLRTGLRPKYDFSATFRIKVDEFFLSRLVAGGVGGGEGSEAFVRIEVNRAIYRDFELMGVAEVSLLDLFVSANEVTEEEEDASTSSLPLVVERAWPIRRSPDEAADVSSIGSLTIVSRLAITSQHQWNRFRRLRPKDARRGVRLLNVTKSKSEIAHASGVPAGGGLGTVGDKRCALIVEIVGCRGLRGGGGDDLISPSPYVHYHVEGHDDTMTNVIKRTSSPEFRHARRYVLPVHSKALRSMRKASLTFTVFDDGKQEGDGDNSEGILGIATVPLRSLSVGGEIVGEYELKHHRSGAYVGELDVILRWAEPNDFRRKVGIVEGESGRRRRHRYAEDEKEYSSPPIHSRDDLDWIAHRFSDASAEEADAILDVDVFEFLRWVMPTRSLASAQQSLRLSAVGAGGDEDEEDETAYEVGYRMLRDALIGGGAKAKATDTSFVSVPEFEAALDQLGWSLKRGAIEELVLTSFEDGGCAGHIESIAKLARLPRNEHERLLETKLRTHFKTKRRHLVVERFLKRAEVVGDGGEGSKAAFVDANQFEEVLRGLQCFDGDGSRGRRAPRPRDGTKKKKMKRRIGTSTGANVLVEDEDEDDVLVEKRSSRAGQTQVSVGVADHIEKKRQSTRSKLNASEIRVVKSVRSDVEEEEEDEDEENESKKKQEDAIDDDESDIFTKAAATSEETKEKSTTSDPKFTDADPKEEGEEEGAASSEKAKKSTDADPKEEEEEAIASSNKTKAKPTDGGAKSDGDNTRTHGGNIVTSRVLKDVDATEKKTRKDTDAHSSDDTAGTSSTTALGGGGDALKKATLEEGPDEKPEAGNKPTTTSSDNAPRSSSVLQKDQKVKAKYAGKKWFPGAVKRVREDGTYDIIYDDGDTEKRVKAEWVRALEENEEASASTSSAAFSEGQKVKAKYAGKKWFPGTVKRIREDGTYDILYDDGDTEKRVKAEWVRALEENEEASASTSSAAFSEGQKRIREDGTYDILYDDGDSEKRVKAEWVRALSSEKGAASDD
eukprot:g4159.t1